MAAPGQSQRTAAKVAFSSLFGGRFPTAVLLE